MGPSNQIPTTVLRTGRRNLELTASGSAEATGVRRRDDCLIHRPRVTTSDPAEEDTGDREPETDDAGSQDPLVEPTGQAGTHEPPDQRPRGR